MRLLGAILTSFALIAGVAIAQLTSAAAAPPPSGGGATRSAYTNATCYAGFFPSPATYPASAQNVKYQCFATASCPPLFTASSPSKAPGYTEFEYDCTRVGSVLPAGKTTCSAGFVPSVPVYLEGEKLTYYCDTKPVTCPSKFNVLDNGVDAGVITGPPPKFFYACISSGPNN